MEQWLLDLIVELGYVGIFIATLVESTFVPIPAEVTVIPAGMLAAQGHLNYWGVLASATGGVIAGSAVNYWIGIRYGRAFILRYGPYIFIKPSFLEKTEFFFTRYGRLAIFVGRFLPGIKHYIAFVAGIAKMRLQPFIIATSLGGLIWIWLLVQLGYMTGHSSESEESVHTLELTVLGLVVVSGIGWIFLHRFLKRRHAEHLRDTEAERLREEAEHLREEAERLEEEADLAEAQENATKPNTII